MLNKKLKFSSIKLKKSTDGKPWVAIVATFKDGENWFSHYYFKPTKDFPDKPIKTQEKALSNKVKHIIEALGGDISEVGSDNFYEFAAQAETAAKPLYHKECYVKTKIKPDGKEVLADWFPFISLSPDLVYSELEQKNAENSLGSKFPSPSVVEEKFPLDDDDDGLPF